jgi:hypothetical protein
MEVPYVGKVTTWDTAVQEKFTTESRVNVKFIRARLYQAVFLAVEEVTDEAKKLALDDVPVRKVFKRGYKNKTSKAFATQAIAGRQEVRQLSLEEALGESLVRRKLGLASAFPTSSTGRRLPSSAPSVMTTDFGSYRSKSRVNPNSDAAIDETRQIRRIDGRNRIVTTVTETGRDAHGREYTKIRPLPRPDIEADLSSQGRLELARATGDTLGGALKKSIKSSVTQTERRTKGKVSAGNKEVDYAKYVEFGTRRSRAQPFLRPALAHAREIFAQKLSQQIRGSGA